MSIFSLFFKREVKKPVVSPGSLTLKEKREARRYPDGQMTYFYPIMGKCFEARIVDISLNGARISSSHKLPGDTRGELLLSFKGTMLRLPMKISWRRELKQSFEYGAQFTLKAPDYSSLIRKYINLSIKKNLLLEKSFS